MKSFAQKRETYASQSQSKNCIDFSFIPIMLDYMFTASLSCRWLLFLLRCNDSSLHIRLTRPLLCVSFFSSLTFIFLKGTNGALCSVYIHSCLIIFDKPRLFSLCELPMMKDQRISYSVTLGHYNDSNQ